MFKNIFTIAIVAVVFGVTAPTSALASNISPLPTQSQGCENSQNNPHCDPVSVPEFGLITGAVAMLTSGGSLLVFRRMRKA